MCFSVILLFNPLVLKFDSWIDPLSDKLRAS